MYYWYLSKFVASLDDFLPLAILCSRRRWGWWGDGRRWPSPRCYFSYQHHRQKGQRSTQHYTTSVISVTNKKGQRSTQYHYHCGLITHGWNQSSWKLEASRTSQNILIPKKITGPNQGPILGSIAVKWSTYTYGSPWYITTTYNWKLIQKQSKTINNICVL